MATGKAMATTKKKRSTKDTSKAAPAAPKANPVVGEKAVHRIVTQTFSARAYVRLRHLPAGAVKALEMKAGDRRHRTEAEWRQMWKTVCSQPA
jgi:hypothetical protein